MILELIKVNSIRRNTYKLIKCQINHINVVDLTAFLSNADEKESSFQRLLDEEEKCYKKSNFLYTNSNKKGIIVV